jgi:chromosome partitioning protein
MLLLSLGLWYLPRRLYAMSANPEEVLTLSPVDPEIRRRVPRASAREIHSLADRASIILKEALAVALEPSAKKTLRKWNRKEVAEMLAISVKTLDRGIDEGKLPAGEQVGRGPRLFTLEQINEIRDTLGLRPWRNPETDPAKVIAVANFKGGVAKTSVAVHLAQYAARKGLRTLLVDLDAQGSATTTFGLRPDADVESSQTFAPWLHGKDLADPDEWTGTLATAVQKTYWPGLDLIAANLQLYGAEFAIAARRTRDSQFLFYRVVADGLDTIKDQYDVIVLDTPPSLSFITSNALFAANGIVMPVPPATMDFASSVSFFQLLAELMDTIDSIEGEAKYFDFLALLVSKYEPKNDAHVAIHDWLREAFARRVLQHPMGQSAVLRFGPDMKTAYEIERYEGDRRTLARALEFMDGVNEEIIQLIFDQWPSKRGRPESPRKGSAA